MEDEQRTALLDVARRLNRSRVSAAPCLWLPALSIFDDEHYENYDYDIVGPGERRRVGEVLRRAGFRQKSGRRWVGEDLELEYPKPTRLLAGDPAAEFERVIDGASALALATPTQVLLTTFRRMGAEVGGLSSELVALVREQPANLDKVCDWLTGDAASRFSRVLPQLWEAQEEGFELRRRGRFRTELPC